ncbi:MAG TPA: hypothetical protein VIH48_01230 [Candidatus Bathyarchaeia archaeon]
MLSWFDVAYAVLNITVIFYCFSKYLSSRRKPFKLFGLGFTCLLISNFIWVLALIPLPNSILALYGYIRLVLYAIFTILIIYALQTLNSSSDEKHN